MPWQEPGKGDKDPWKSNGQQPPDLEEVFARKGNIAVVGIAGPVIDVEFPPSSLPELNMAVEFEVEIGGDIATHDQDKRVGKLLGQRQCLTDSHDAGLFPVRADDADLRCGYVAIAPRLFR